MSVKGIYYIDATTRAQVRGLLGEQLWNNLTKVYSRCFNPFLEPYFIEPTRLYVFLDDDLSIIATAAVTYPAGRFIYSVCTDPSYQRQGYGRELLETILDQLEGGTFYLDVFRNNAGAIRLYESLGFKIARNKDADSYVMERSQDPRKA